MPFCCFDRRGAPIGLFPAAPGLGGVDAARGQFRIGMPLPIRHGVYVGVEAAVTTQDRNAGDISAHYRVADHLVHAPALGVTRAHERLRLSRVPEVVLGSTLTARLFHALCELANSALLGFPSPDRP